MKQKILLFILISTILLELGYISLLKNPEKDMVSLSEMIIAECSNKPHRPSCYDSETPRLMDTHKITLEEAFEIAKIIQKRDSSYRYCHVLGHNISAKETNKNPDKWLDVIPRCPTGICSNGCLHGAAQEKFRKEHLTDEELTKVKKQISQICLPRENWNPTGLETSECIHGIGHLTMYMTNANIAKSINICDSLSAEIGTKKLCYEGMFMQLFQPLEEEDFALVEGKVPNKNNLRNFCSSFREINISEACWRQGFALHREKLRNPKETVAYCSQTDPNQIKHCYSMLFYVEAQNANYDMATLKSFCNGINNEFKKMCFGEMANAIIHGGSENISMAVSFCKSIKDEDLKNGCEESLAFLSAYNLKSNSKEFINLCESLDDKNKENCLNNKRW